MIFSWFRPAYVVITGEFSSRHRTRMWMISSGLPERLQPRTGFPAIHGKPGELLVQVAQLSHSVRVRPNQTGKWGHVQLVSADCWCW